MFDRTRPRAAMLAVALAAVVCATAMAPAAAREGAHEGAREATTADAAGTGERFRVMSYNIQAGTGADRVFDLERTARAIGSQRPDAVALQEVDVNWSPRSDYVDEANWLATRLRMHVFFAPIYTLEPEPDRPGAPPRRFGLAVLSRHPILRAYNHEITRLSTQVPDPVPAPAPGFPEVLLNARGTPVWLYGTHLDYRGDPAIRQAQVADTLRIMGRRHGHRLLLGDFNAAPEAAELAPLWRPLRDALTLAGRPDAPTYPAATPTKRLDYVTVSATPGLRVRDAWVPDTLASDHRPVVADVEINR
jgi:endonuclease/exonuclease/phosphatase family metal-dependent hydrolase